MKHRLKLPTGTTSLGGYTPKIVIVDDDEAHLQFIRLIMAREEYPTEILLFDNPQTGLDYLLENPVDLVLLDVMMPGMSGFQLLEKLRQDDRTADLPVIFLTSTQDTEHVVHAFEAGAVDYIAKPINSAVLTARIGGVLQRKFLENELRLHNQELERLNRFKNELVSVISHDLRSPLAAIEVICQNWKSRIGQDGADGSGKKRIDRIVNQSRLARRLVENFLDYDKMEQGRLVPEPTFFPLNQLLDDCAEDEQPLLQDRELVLQMIRPEETLLLFADREMIAQAVRNVLGNAIKFAANRIVLRATPEGLNDQSGGTLRLTITDDGGGIPADILPTIFDKYSKADPNAPGTGLGLYITRQVMLLHNGSVSAGSAPGVETNFSFEIPLLYQPESLPDLGDLAQASVVVVSSSRHAAVLLESILSEAGMVGVSSVVVDEPSLEELTRSNPQLVVADLSPDVKKRAHLSQLLSQIQPDAVCLLHGPEQVTEDFLKTAAKPHACLAAPVDPLKFLRITALLLRGETVEGAATFG